MPRHEIIFIGEIELFIEKQALPIGEHLLLFYEN